VDIPIEDIGNRAQQSFEWAGHGGA
jgi:hypothetical protein